MAESGSLTVYPSSYLASASTTGLTPTNTSNPVGKSSANTSGYARFKFNYSNPLTAVYGFDVSAVPANAEIDSVSCTAGLMYSVATTANIYLYSGSTSVASQATYIPANGKRDLTVSGGAWTRDMLSDIRLVIKQTSSNSTQVSVYFYGADLTVTYTYQSEKFMLKLGGSWTDVARVFKKVNGIWVEQEELANVIEDGVRYKNGGEIESAAPPVTLISFTITPMYSSTSYTYQAEEGMTWSEWVASEYNTDGYIVSGGSIKNSDGSKTVVTTQLVAVGSTDVIADGGSWGLY